MTVIGEADCQHYIYYEQIFILENVFYLHCHVLHDFMWKNR